MDEQKILNILRDACACLQNDDVAGYITHLEQATEIMDSLPKTGQIYGEYLLVSAFIHITDVKKLLEHFREAANYIEGRSLVLPSEGALFFNYYNVFAICNPKPGHARENAKYITELVDLFYRFTGGGLGTDICYRAQLAYLQGHLDDAQTLATEAFEAARSNQQWLVAICCAEVLARVAIHDLNNNLWQFACNYLESMTENCPSSHPSCQQQAELLLADLDLSIGHLQNVPRWIQDKKYVAVPAPWGYQMTSDIICPQALPAALSLQVAYTCYKGDPVPSLNIADLAQKAYGIDNLLLNSHFEFFRAGAYLLLEQYALAKEHLQRGMNLVAEDGLWLIPAVFFPAYEEEITAMASEIGKKALTRIRSIGKDFWNKLAPLRKEKEENASLNFTKRELEILPLLTSGKTNAELATELCISELTLKCHIGSIYRKLDITRRGELADALKRHRATGPAIWVDYKE